MHQLTNDGRRYKLRVDIVDSGGNNRHESYDDFSVGPHKQFVLHVGAYTGNAGKLNTSGPRCFLEQEALPLLLSTGWFQERIRA